LREKEGIRAPGEKIPVKMRVRKRKKKSVGWEGDGHPIRRGGIIYKSAGNVI